MQRGKTRCCRRRRRRQLSVAHLHARASLALSQGDDVNGLTAPEHRRRRVSCRRGGLQRRTRRQPTASRRGLQQTEVGPSNNPMTSLDSVRLLSPADM